MASELTLLLASRLNQSTRSETLTTPAWVRGPLNSSQEDRNSLNMAASPHFLWKGQVIEKGVYESWADIPPKCHSNKVRIEHKYQFHEDIAPQGSKAC